MTRYTVFCFRRCLLIVLYNVFWSISLHMFLRLNWNIVFFLKLNLISYFLESCHLKNIAVFQFSWDILKERRNLVQNFNMFFKVYWCLLYLFLAGKENETEKESWAGWMVHKISLNLPKRNFMHPNLHFSTECSSLAFSYTTPPCFCLSLLHKKLTFLWLERVKCFLDTSFFFFFLSHSCERKFNRATLM